MFVFVKPHSTIDCISIIIGTVMRIRVTVGVFDLFRDHWTELCYGFLEGLVRVRLLTFVSCLDMAEQYAFAAEERAIDHSHYLLWAEVNQRG